jgi:16S rRNA A1518/A1519 N6-dimethyltransferase RsmA/KsgA/DIM1 with predicted DNA glycosylase/AP lyase activity
MNKKSSLNQSAKWYNSSEGFKQNWGDFHKRLMLYRFATIKKWLRGERCLEFGTADGESTQFLFDYFKKVVAVEGAGYFVNQVKQRFAEHWDAGRFRVHQFLFEGFHTD